MMNDSKEFGLLDYICITLTVLVLLALLWSSCRGSQPTYHPVSDATAGTPSRG